VLQNCNDIFGQVSLHVICLVPVARYISAKCCNDRDHVRNYTEADYAHDIEAGLELAEDLLTGWAQNIASRADIINFRSVADDPEQLLQDLRIEDDLFWAEEDPVHCIAKVYSAMAGSLTSLLNSGEDEGEGEPATKRQRLESVVIQRSGSATNAALRRSTASWSTGSLPPSQGRGGRARTVLTEVVPSEAGREAGSGPMEGAEAVFKQNGLLKSDCEQKKELIS
jgi:hypothetical protein